jgi:hypothetical protein
MTWTKKARREQEAGLKRMMACPKPLSIPAFKPVNKTRMLVAAVIVVLASWLCDG